MTWKATVESMRRAGWTPRVLRPGATPDDVPKIIDYHSATPSILAQYRDPERERGSDYRWLLGNDFAPHEEIGVEIAARFALAGIISPTQRAAFNSLRAALRPALARIASVATTTRRRTHWDTTGEEISIARALDGASECFGERRRGAVKQTVRIGVQAGHTSEVTEAQFLRNAALAACACEALTASGRQVEIWALVWSDSQGPHDLAPEWVGVETISRGVCIKRADRPLDVQSVLSLAYPARHRIVNFGTHHAAGLRSSYGGRTEKNLDAIVNAYRFDAFVRQALNVTPGSALDVPLWSGFIGDAAEIVKRCKLDAPDPDAQARWVAQIAGEARKLGKRA